MIGFDVSNNNGHIDWDKVATDPQNLGFCFAKATEGLGFTDKFYVVNRSGAKQHGIPFGAYHFIHLDEDGVAQADHFLSVAKLKTGDLAPVLDFEWAHMTVSPLKARKVANDFLGRVRAKTGRKPIFYTAPTYAQQAQLTANFTNYPLWVANYGVKVPHIPPPWKQAAFWQYTSSGTVSGVHGRCDMNKLLVPCDPLGCYRL